MVAQDDRAKTQQALDLSLQLALRQKGVSQATLQVAVRCRPLLPAELDAQVKSITRVVDQKMVLVQDPEVPSIMQQMGQAPPAGDNRGREKRFIFDHAFDGSSSNSVVYRGTVQELVPGVLKGLNATVFAYGATGSGKTHSMVGDQSDPGLMVLGMRDIFLQIDKEEDQQFEVTCSYCEVYNELIYDLLIPASGALDLREDPEQGPVVAGLSHIRVESAERIISLLQEGNTRRKTESTDANAVSSRSHAVLEVQVKRRELTGASMSTSTGKLTLVDLAGSERASETNNRGRQLRDGAAINRSLLALANCINALGKRRKTGFVFVPFRNSKLTRLLKDGLCGNSRTAMIATVATGTGQYHHTLNTLKYADRAKEIKTHVRRNTGSVALHVAQMKAVILQLQQQNAALKAMVNSPAHAHKTMMRPRRRASDPGTDPPELNDDLASVHWVLDTATALEKATQACVDAQREVVFAEDRAIRAQAEVDSLAHSEAPAPSTSQEDHPKDLRLHNAMAAVRETERLRQEAHAHALDTAARRGEIGHDIDLADAGPERDKLHKELASGTQTIERVHAHAQAQVSDRLVEDQSGVIANLWRILGWAGISPQQVTELAQRHGLEGTGVQEQPAPSDPPQLGHVLTGAFTSRRHTLWAARKATLDVASPPTQDLEVQARNLEAAIRGMSRSPVRGHAPMRAIPENASPTPGLSTASSASLAAPRPAPAHPRIPHEVLSGSSRSDPPIPSHALNHLASHISQPQSFSGHGPGSSSGLQSSKPRGSMVQHHREGSQVSSATAQKLHALAARTPQASSARELGDSDLTVRAQGSVQEDSAPNRGRGEAAAHSESEGTPKPAPESKMKGALARLKPSMMMGGARDKSGASPTTSLAASVNSPFSRPSSGKTKGLPRTTSKDPPMPQASRAGVQASANSKTLGRLGAMMGQSRKQ